MFFQGRQGPHLLLPGTYSGGAGCPGRGCSGKTPESSGDRLGASGATKEQGGRAALEQTEGVGPQAHLSLPPRLFPSDLFKRKNRKAEKWGGGLGAGGVVAGKGPRFLLVVQVPKVVVSRAWVGFPFQEGPNSWGWGPRGQQEEGRL